ncbi:septum formation family protein [Corynebacterium variabile]|uniref:septum formation family protein n=1 Tax=Corynebacterium variabile TaxID=1727 RepID=UPI0026478893|nr:septum formation family protein [Corynebacterium variabile]MDN6240574.1 septum formation family protein [Corynebacterium variabile]MDN6476989.1 septum formation family protein [Corynebacterium variabile]MDN6843809.1 septum formation family protein [Corynebacterium variabile]
MRKTTSGARALLSATAVVAAAGLALTACTSDDSSTPEGGDTSAPAPETDVDPATLGLAVGDCVADLGAAAGEVAPEDSDADAEDAADAGDAGDAGGAEEATTEDTEAADETATDVPEGIDGTVPTSTAGVVKADCDDPHVGEVYAQQDLDNQVLFPGARMSQFTAAVCTGETFEDYIGYPFDSSIFDVITYAPSKESWAAGDRTVTCVVTDPSAGYIPGTLEGAGY